MTQKPLVTWLVAAFGAVVLAEAALGWWTVPPDGLLDPDSYMRVVRLREMLHTGSLTHVVAADNGGLGTVVYWSHLVDAFVLLLAAPFRLFVGSDEALRLGAAWTGPLTAGCVAAALVWAPAPLAERRWLWIAPFSGFAAPSILGYGLFGWVHHHLPLVLASVMAAGCAGRAAFGDTRAGAWCGVAAAFGIWLSPEALPYVLMAIGAIGVAWCLRPSEVARPLLAAAGAFLLLLAAATLADPPDGGVWAPEIDCLSVAYVVLAALICGAALLLCTVGGALRGVMSRAAAGTAAGAAVVGVWVALYPAIVHGLGGLIPAADVHAYFDAISEMRPIGDVSDAAQRLLNASVGVVMAGVLAWRRRDVLWAYAGVCGAVVIGLALAFIRFSAYAEALGAMAVPVAISAVDTSALAGERRRLLRLALLAFVLVGPFVPGLFGPTAPPPSGAQAAACNVADIAPALRKLPGAIVLTGIGDTPEILWRTPVHTVGSLYHRSIGAFVRARNAWRTLPSDTLPDAVRDTGASYVLACDLASRTMLVADLPTDTLQDRLTRHMPPPWLKLEAHAGGYRLYRVVTSP